MCDDDELPRALQNHLVQARHLTTLPALWMPQYAQACAGSSTLQFLRTVPSEDAPRPLTLPRPAL
jgi:hypothetical protein